MQTITLKEALPNITDPVTINGESQAGYAPGLPRIVIDGSLVGDDANGLTFLVGGNTVEGLVIDNFTGFTGGGEGFGIVLDGTADPDDPSTIEANFLGTDSSGTTPEPNNGGILLHNSSGNFIGGLNDQGNLVAGNLISGNRDSGIFIDSQLSGDNDIEGNYIGTDVTGLHAISNGLDGIFLGPAEGDSTAGFPSGNLITSPFNTATQQFDPNGRNIIAGNKGNGVYILGGTENGVQGNYIGIGADGMTPIPNGEDGVRIEDGNKNNVGGPSANMGNVISANAHNGIEIVADAVSENLVSMPTALQNAEHNLVQGNFIGTDASGKFSDPDKMPDSGDELGNGQDGVALTDDLPLGSVSDNTIGSTDDENSTADDVAARNVISGNLDNGILFAGAGVVNNAVDVNFIGTDMAGTSAIPNAHLGILFNGITGETEGPSENVIAGNLISGNGIANLPDGLPTGGVRIANGSDLNDVVNNHIGTDSSFLKPLSNVGNGVTIDNSAACIIGGPASGDENVIAANTGDGVAIVGASATSNQVQLNLIGIGGDTVTPLGNADGVVVSSGASDNMIGGIEVTPEDEDDLSLGNVIAANLNNGVLIEDGATTNQVVGNFIGTNALGAKLEGNVGGVDIVDASNNIIGGTTTAGRNYIENSSTSGIQIIDTSGIGSTGPPVTSGNVVEGNYIGVGLDGTSPMPNSTGVLINSAPLNFIGTSAAGARNVISGNLSIGVQIQGIAANSNVVAGNYIGTTADGGTVVLGRD